MLEDVHEFIKSNNMIQPSDVVIVAVSGGPDSICLLHMLSSMKDKLNIKLLAAHVNHGLRGNEADRDESYAKQLSQELNIPFFSKKVDLDSISKSMGISHELAGREVRYSFFEELKAKHSANKIALAHNANDRAETILMRIIRGTGTDGLEGIKAIRDEYIIRPLIETSRAQIEEYCIQNNLELNVDSTNLEGIYSRNKIRLELIPYIQKNFNSDIISTLNRMSDILKSDNDYLDKVAKLDFQKHCQVGINSVTISKYIFMNHEAIATRIIRESIHKLLSHNNNIQRNHVLDILKLSKLKTGNSIMLPNKLTAINNYGDVILRFNFSKEVKDENTYKIELGCECYIESFNLSIFITEKNVGEITETSSKNIKYFDADKVNGDIIIRARKDGDRIMPAGMKGTKKVKDLLMDLKIQKENRDKIPILCFGSDIAWIVGVRTSEKFKVDKNSKKILVVKIISRGEQ